MSGYPGPIHLLGDAAKDARLHSANDIIVQFYELLVVQKLTHTTAVLVELAFNATDATQRGVGIGIPEPVKAARCQGFIEGAALKLYEIDNACFLDGKGHDWLRFLQGYQPHPKILNFR